MPISRSVRITRMAISPRLATSTLANIRAASGPRGPRRLPRGASGSGRRAAAGPAPAPARRRAARRRRPPARRAAPGQAPRRPGSPAARGSQRDVPVLAGGRRLALGQRGLQGPDEPGARLLGLDDVVHVAPLGGDVRVREALLVLL